MREGTLQSPPAGAWAACYSVCCWSMHCDCFSAATASQMYMAFHWRLNPILLDCSSIGPTGLILSKRIFFLHNVLFVPSVCSIHILYQIKFSFHMSVQCFEFFFFFALPMGEIIICKRNREYCWGSTEGTHGFVFKSDEAWLLLWILRALETQWYNHELPLLIGILLQAFCCDSVNGTVSDASAFLTLQVSVSVLSSLAIIVPSKVIFVYSLVALVVLNCRPGREQDG